MQKWEYLRLTVSYRAENQIQIATLNGREFLCPNDNASRQDLQDYIEAIGDDGWELITVYENYLLNEIFHFKRVVE